MRDRLCRPCLFGHGALHPSGHLTVVGQRYTLLVANGTQVTGNSDTDVSYGQHYQVWPLTSLRIRRRFRVQWVARAHSRAHPCQR